MEAHTLILMIKFAEGIVLIAEEEKDLQNALIEMQSTIKKYKMNINTNKTNILVCVKNLVAWLKFI